MIRAVTSVSLRILLMFIMILDLEENVPLFSWYAYSETRDVSNTSKIYIFLSKMVTLKKLFLTIKNDKHMIRLSGKLICMRDLL